MEIYRRFAMKNDGLFTYENLQTEEEVSYKSVFLPFTLSGSQLDDFLNLYLYALRIAGTFGTAEILPEKKISTSAFRNEKITIYSAKLINERKSDVFYPTSITIANGKGENQICIRHVKHEYGEDFTIFLDKTNGRYRDVNYKLSDLDTYLSSKAGIPSFYELTHPDTSDFPKDFY